MIKAGLTRLLQHLIAQNSWAKPLLHPFAGKSLQLSVSALQQSLIVLEDGQLAIAGETNIPDAIITLSPTLLLRLLAQDEAAKMQIKFSGDAELVKVFAQVFSNIRWDIEADLSHLMGDIPAHQLSHASQKFASSIRSGAKNITETVLEFLQEEKPFIAKKRNVEIFNAEVDALRTNIARFEKKIDKLTQRAQKLTQHAPHS